MHRPHQLPIVDGGGCRRLTDRRVQQGDGGDGRDGRPIAVAPGLPDPPPRRHGADPQLPAELRARRRRRGGFGTQGFGTQGREGFGTQGLGARPSTEGAPGTRAGRALGGSVALLLVVARRRTAAPLVARPRPRPIAVAMGMLLRFLGRLVRRSAQGDNVFGVRGRGGTHVIQGRAFARWPVVRRCLVCRRHAGWLRG